ncbi:HNH endonuclease signature motif containing protein [Streptomyces scabiei]|uniref:HNH endonuclease signature motif containing protein n=1 Tax=Streptomyces scabiei TaxID=1930 RepID=UPI0029A51CB8|nr:HNH endonuclease signature motif containing protein [Streptomyces scabiei]MDX3520753.1 HNH endonuclease signature motif containing protein [Streptomyces scabiei]
MDHTEDETRWEPTRRIAAETIERFWSKVDRTDGCWLWEASKTGTGYGRFSLNGQMVLAHRFAYELQRGEIPAGLHVDHLCRVRHCVNPAHLEPVTCRENLMRGDTPAARNASKTHCVKGHEYTPQNTYVAPPNPHNPNGFRHCRDCKRQSRQAHEARVRAARTGGARDAV